MEKGAGVGKYSHFELVFCTVRACRHNCRRYSNTIMHRSGTKVAVSILSLVFEALTVIPENKASVTRHNAYLVTKGVLLSLRTWPGDLAVFCNCGEAVRDSLQIRYLAFSELRSDLKLWRWKFCRAVGGVRVAMEMNVSETCCVSLITFDVTVGDFFFCSQDELALLECRSSMQRFNTSHIQGRHRIPMWTRFCAQTVFLINMRYQTSVRNLWRLYLFDFTSFNKILHHIQAYLYAFMYSSRLCPKNSHTGWQRI